MNEEIMKAAGFQKQLDLVKQGRCPLCAKKVYKSELRNAIEVNEFKISGLGHCCQPQMFKPDGTLRE